jgi:hypothetical protein
MEKNISNIAKLIIFSGFYKLLTIINTLGVKETMDLKYIYLYSF